LLRAFIRHKTLAFTLIELVLVIVILGIITAFLLPKFANLENDAELGQIEYVASSFKVGVESVHKVFLTKGYPTRVQNLPGFGDGDVDTNNSGYPIGTDKGNGNENIGRGNNGCVLLWNGLLQNPPSVSSTNNNADYRSYRHSDNRFCSYVYRRNGDSGNQNTGLIMIRYDSRNGDVSVCGQRVDIPAC
jgi:prepilin-type N-terminal cleavage/methylation domain-containing protein